MTDKPKTPASTVSIDEGGFDTACELDLEDLIVEMKEVKNI